MKANKVKECKECLSWQNCQYSIWPEGRIPLACPLPDWPEVALLEAYKQWFKLAPDQMSIGTPMGAESFIQFIDWLRSIGVIIREREEEKDGK